MTDKEDITPGRRTGVKLYIVAVKLLLTSAMVYVVIMRVDIEEIKTYIKGANWLYLFYAFVALNIAQTISALRERYYFSRSSLKLSRGFIITLYYVGMLFNLILPGGIGGDGYKAYYLYKNKKFSWKTTIRLIISTRASGALFLLLTAAILCFFSLEVRSVPFATALLTGAILLLIPAYSIFVKTLLKENIATQLGAIKYSAIIQGIFPLIGFFMLAAVGYQGGIINYLILFMAATLATMLPISIGGMGLREITFLYGAPLLSIDGEIGVTISVLYFVVNALASLLGLAFLWRLRRTENR